MFAKKNFQVPADNQELLEHEEVEELEPRPNDVQGPNGAPDNPPEATREEKTEELKEIEETRIQRACLLFADFVRPIVIVFLGLLLSLTVASKIRFYPVLQFHLVSSSLVKSAHHANLKWIGELYATISLVFMPLTVGIIQIFELNYRFAIFLGGSLHLLGCVTSSGVLNPEYLVITDAFLNGIGSSIVLSVVILVMDDLFEEGSSYRLLVTSLCQGSVIGGFFICDVFSMMLVHFGWRYSYMILGGVMFGEALLACIIFPPTGLVCCTAFNPENPDNILLPSREQDRRVPWKKRLLGITAEDLSRSPSLLAWLFERMWVEIIINGIFLLLLRSTQMAADPFLPTSHNKKRMEMLSAFSYSGGQAITFILGALLATPLTDFLIHMYTASAVGLMLSLLCWQTIRVYLNYANAVAANVIFALLSGACIGLLQTFAYCASEKATRIDARKVYPLTKMMSGLANVVGPLLYWALGHASSSVNIWLGCFSLMAGCDAIILVFILHKLHVTRPHIFKTLK